MPHHLSGGFIIIRPFPSTGRCRKATGRICSRNDLPVLSGLSGMVGIQILSQKPAQKEEIMTQMRRSGFKTFNEKTRFKAKADRGVQP